MSSTPHWPRCWECEGKEDIEYLDEAMMGSYFDLNKNVYLIHSISINRAGVSGHNLHNLFHVYLTDLSCFWQKFFSGKLEKGG